MRPTTRRSRGAVLALILAVVTLSASGGAAEGHGDALPGAPLDVAATPGPGMGRITLTWTAPASGEVAGYRIHGATWEGFEAPLAEVGPEATTWTEEDLGQGATRVYQVRAFNDAGDGPPGPRASATTYLACTPGPPVCVGVHPVAFLRDVGHPAPETDDHPDVFLPVEVGHLRVEVGGIHAEQAIAVPRGTGFPDPATLEQTVGPVRVTYTHAMPLPPFGGVALDVPPAAGERHLGSLWSGRFLVYLDALKLTDLPVVAFREGEPGPDVPGAVPGPGLPVLAAAVAAAAGAARQATRRRDR